MEFVFQLYINALPLVSHLQELQYTVGTCNILYSSSYKTKFLTKTIFTRLKSLPHETNGDKQTFWSASPCGIEPDIELPFEFFLFIFYTGCSLFHEFGLPEMYNLHRASIHVCSYSRDSFFVAAKYSYKIQKYIRHVA